MAVVVEQKVTHRELEKTERHAVTLVKVPEGCFHKCIRRQSVESATIVRGQARIVIDGQERKLTPLIPHTTVLLTASKVFQFFNDQKEVLEILYVSTSEPSSAVADREKLHVQRAEDCNKYVAAPGETIMESLGNYNGNTKEQSIALVEIIQGVSSKAHFHPVIEESYYITEGEARLVIDNQTTIIQAGELAKIPVGKVHQIFNDKSQTLKFIAVCAPAWTTNCGEYL